jgi:hypothetical protein
MDYYNKLETDDTFAYKSAFFWLVVRTLTVNWECVYGHREIFHGNGWLMQQSNIQEEDGNTNVRKIWRIEVADTVITFHEIYKISVDTFIWKLQSPLVQEYSS